MIVWLNAIACVMELNETAHEFGGTLVPIRFQPLLSAQNQGMQAWLTLFNVVVLQTMIPVH